MKTKILFVTMILLLSSCTVADFGVKSETIEIEESITIGGELETEEKETLSLGMKNALQSAKEHLATSAFSRESLIDKLETEQYTNKEATYGADNCGVDWRKQAVEKAKAYLDAGAFFSYERMIFQLEYEQFTTEEATYGADNCGADWYEQAVKQAEYCTELMTFTRNSLITRLEFEGFTTEQAEYAANELGY